MQIHYIGKKTTCKGKRLFDILCRLKNFGVGRIVLRNHYLQQYPEPTYYVIQKVDPDMSDPTQVLFVGSRNFRSHVLSLPGLPSEWPHSQNFFLKFSIGSITSVLC